MNQFSFYYIEKYSAIYVARKHPLPRGWTLNFIFFCGVSPYVPSWWWKMKYYWRCQIGNNNKMSENMFWIQKCTLLSAEDTYLRYVYVYIKYNCGVYAFVIFIYCIAPRHKLKINRNFPGKETELHTYRWKEIHVKGSIISRTLTFQMK